MSTSSQSSRKRVFVGMSGGVDSSVAVHLLKEQGHEVVGVYLLCFSGEEETCTAERDMEDARAAARHLGIPFYVWNLEKEYKERVIDYMVEGYRAGLTPNPDVMCNREIKFGIFLKRALALGADYVATGHYVRVVPLPAYSPRKQNNFSPAEKFSSPSARLPFGTEPIGPAGRSSENMRAAASFSLFSARDKNKDQSYFLWTLTQDQLKHCLFPIGDYLKSEVRAIAKEAGLPNAEKKDSQGVCFVGKIKLPEFLSASIPVRRGAVVTTSGKKIGEHDGAEFFTIGQRHIRIMNQESGIKGRHETKPHYVAEKDVRTNTITVAEGDDDPALYRKEIELTNVNFIDPEVDGLIRANSGIEVMTRIRYRAPLAEAELKIENCKLKITFASPQKFVAPGQSAVFYSKDGELLGGGVIVLSNTKRLPTSRPPGVGSQE